MRQWRLVVAVVIVLVIMATATLATHIDWATLQGNMGGMVGRVFIADPRPGFADNFATINHAGALAVELKDEAGYRATLTGTSLDVNCTGGCAGSSGGDAVNVFHQSTVRHVSSVTHITGTLMLTNRAASSVVSLTGTSLDVNCTGGCGTAAEGQTYVAIVEASAAAASKDHLNLFNASGSGKVLKILSITANPDLAAAVTGLVQSFDIVRTTTAGSTCTALTIRLVDSNNAAVPAQVTASNNCTTDPTLAFILGGFSQDGEDARSANALYGNGYTFRANGGQPWTLREGQGLSIRSSALSGAWPVTAAIEFTM